MEPNIIHSISQENLAAFMNESGLNAEVVKIRDTSANDIIITCYGDYKGIVSNLWDAQGKTNHKEATDFSVDVIIKKNTIIDVLDFNDFNDGMCAGRILHENKFNKIRYIQRIILTGGVTKQNLTVQIRLIQDGVAQAVKYVQRAEQLTLELREKLNKEFKTKK